jgi:hypothetical protein
MLLIETNKKIILETKRKWEKNEKIDERMVNEKHHVLTDQRSHYISYKTIYN